MQRIFKPLLRHPSMPLLVVLQVALACAIGCNVIFLLQQKLAPVVSSDGIEDPSRLLVVSKLVAQGTPWSSSRLREAESSLRAVPGVSAVSYAATFPAVSRLKMNANVVGVRNHTKANTVFYVGDNLVRTLGLLLVAGRNFSEVEENVTLDDGMGFHTAGPVIITAALARRLFPEGNVLGRQIGYEGSPGGQRTVVGIVAHLMRNDIDQTNIDSLDYSMLLPGVPKQWPGTVFAVRVDSVSIGVVQKAVLNIIHHELGAEMLPGVVPEVSRYSDLRNDMLANEIAAAWLLLGVTSIVFIVTLTGIGGMTSYWVRQRTRQVGIRRALGARRGDILLAFHIENFYVVGVGVLLGVVAAYAANIWLMRNYEFPRLPWNYLLIGGVVFLLLGQFAAWVPALRATQIAPVVATRNV